MDFRHDIYICDYIYSFRIIHLVLLNLKKYINLTFDMERFNKFWKQLEQDITNELYHCYTSNTHI